MARINQGVFNRIIKDVEVIINEYETIRERYFPNGEWDCNMDFYTDFAYEANGIYINALNILKRIEAIMPEIKFEDEKKRQRYSNYIVDMNKIERNIVEQFGFVLELYNQSGRFGDMEQVTLEGMEIYRDNFI